MQERALILSHHSAISFWMGADDALGNAPKETAIAPVIAPMREFPVCFELATKLLDNPAQLHLLTNIKGNARLTGRIAYHYQAVAEPAASYRKIESGLYVCAPWLSLIQIAQKFSVVRTAEVAMNLCGIYVMHKGELPQRTHRIATIGLLKNQILAHGTGPGCKRALRALSLISADSRSPMETKNMLVICLPYRYGGFGLMYPKMNHKILPGRAKGLVGQGEFYGDLCWADAKVIIEYNGSAYHTDTAKEERRKRDLETLGWRVFTVYYETLVDVHAFEKLALEIGRAIGHRDRRPDDWMEKHLALRKELGIGRRFRQGNFA